MLLVALDTTTRSGSHAIVQDGTVVVSEVGDVDRPHAERLPGELLDALAAHGFALNQVDAFAVAAGPGSFTGLRIGIAAMQGLAYATGKPVVGVSALDALARSALLGCQPVSPYVAVWMDAQRGEVFAALYRCIRSGSGAWAVEPADDPVSSVPTAVLDRWRGRGVSGASFIGDGALHYRDELRAAGDLAALVIEPTPLLAPVIGAIALERLESGGSFLPHAIAPIYVRRSDAELSRDRRQAGA